MQSPDHIGLLIYGTFNASIPREHISQTHYEWRASTQEDQAEEESDEAEEADQEQPYEYKKNEFGEWIDKKSGQGVADNNGVIEFNVVKYVSSASHFAICNFYGFNNRFFFDKPCQCK